MKPTPPAAGTGRRRSAAALLLLTLAIAVAATGCVPAAVMAGIGLVGGPQSMAASGSKEAYAGRGSTVQNGRTDPAIGEALHASDREITDECRAAAEKMRNRESGPGAGTNPSAEPDATGPGSCANRWVCLPGFRHPILMQLCRPADGGQPAHAESSS